MNVIPRILHFVWVGSALPAWADTIIDGWRRLHPTWTIKVHGDEAVHPALRETYARLERPDQRSDLIRMSVLYAEGGWYFDTDFWPFRSLDGAEEIFGLDATRVMISEQWGHKSGDRLPYGNAPLACAKGSEAMLRLIERAAITENDRRCAFGPFLVKAAVEDRPGDFTILPSGWFFPLSIQDVAEGAGALLPNQAHGLLRLRTERSGGALPYAAHLWASAVDPEISFGIASAVDARPLAVVEKRGHADNPMNFLAQGLEACGFRVERCQHPKEVTTKARRVEILACWNGLRDPQWCQASRELGVPLLRMEHGFYGRGDHFHVDHRGILHNASWAGDREPVPHGAVYHEPVRARAGGPLLFLGQVSGDTQLLDSEVQGAPQALQMLQRAAPHGFPLVFRPHPQAVRHALINGHLRQGWALEGCDEAETVAYRQEKHGMGLADSLSRARFCVAINSNALVEATLAGIPCLAFGPAIGIAQGVYRQATPATLRDDIQAMIDGWQPDPVDVDRFLRLLAYRQFSREQLASPAVAAHLVMRAGIQPPNVALADRGVAA